MNVLPASDRYAAPLVLRFRITYSGIWCHRFCEIVPDASHCDKRPGLVVRRRAVLTGSSVMTGEQLVPIKMSMLLDPATAM